MGVIAVAVVTGYLVGELDYGVGGEERRGIFRFLIRFAERRIIEIIAKYVVCGFQMNLSLF